VERGALVAQLVQDAGEHVAAGGQDHHGAARGEVLVDLVEQRAGLAQADRQPPRLGPARSVGW
jgi:hypothetical protein